jgi:Skp family chaperone for outer membrane proteins
MKSFILALKKLLLVVIIGVFCASPFAIWYFSKTDIAVVDTEFIVMNSKATAKVNENLQEVQKKFNESLKELEKLYKDTKKEERERVMAEAEAVLVQALQEQRKAVRQALDAIIREEVKVWREAQHVTVVLERSSVLDGKAVRDATLPVMNAVNNREVPLPALPAITIVPPEGSQKEGAAPAATKK